MLWNFSWTTTKTHKEDRVRITTDFGTIDSQVCLKRLSFTVQILFTSQKNSISNDTQFYRVIQNFVIQGGNSDDRKTLIKRRKIGKYLLPNDYDKGFKHDRGMVSMPSKNVENPYKKASPFEFFIVQQQGGAHHLDGDYTIFGKVIRGMDVVDNNCCRSDRCDRLATSKCLYRKIEILK